MSRRHMLLPTLAVLAAGCGEAKPAVPREAPLVTIGMPSAQGQRISDSVYWNMGVRPDSVMRENGTLRVVLPGRTFGRRAYFEGKGCRLSPVPYGAMRAVALHALGARDPSVHIDTVQVALSLVSDTIAHGWGLIRTTKSCGGTGTAPFDAAKLAMGAASPGPDSPHAPRPQNRTGGTAAQ